MLKHRRDDVGIVDLTTAAAMGGEKVEEPVEHIRSLLGDIEGGPKAPHIGNCGRHWQGRRGCLGPRHRGEVLAEHLGADPQA